MVMRFMFSSFIFLQCSKAMNLPFAVEFEVKLSVESESQLIIAHSCAMTQIFIYNFNLQFELLSTLFTSHVMLKYCKKLKAKIPEILEPIFNPFLALF